MLKKFKTRFVLIAFTFSVAQPIALSSTMRATAPTSEPNDLNRRLLSAVCAQNWIQAVGVVDQMIAIVPRGSVRGELLNYRGRLVNLEKSGVVLPPEVLTDCVSKTQLSSVIKK